MQFQRTIPDRSPDLVIAELMKMLGPEIETFWQAENCIIIFGLIKPPGAATRADMTILAFHNIHNSTVIDVELEDRPTGGHPVEDSHHQIQSVLQEIFDVVYEKLDCTLPQLDRVDELPAESDLHTEIEVLEEKSAGFDQLGRYGRQTVSYAQRQHASLKAFLCNSLVKLSFANPSVSRGKTKIYLDRLLSLRPALLQQRQLATAGGVAVLVACLTIVAIYFKNTHSHAMHSDSFLTVTPKPPQVSTPISKGVTAVALKPNNETQHQQREEPGPQLAPARNLRNVDSVIQEWAASQRTRDAKEQASFYADKVDYYLGHDAATRSDVLHYMQDAIRDRKGLWAFSIENISIHRHAANIAFVHFRKHLMTQTDSVTVKEQFIPSSLVVQRTNGTWSIIREENLSPASASIR